MAPAIVVALVAILWVAAGSPTRPRDIESMAWRLGYSLWIVVALFAVAAFARQPPSCEEVFRAAWLRQTVWEPNDIHRELNRRLPDWQKAQDALRRGEIEPESFSSLGAVSARCRQPREALRDFALAAYARPR